MKIIVSLSIASMVLFANQTGNMDYNKMANDMYIQMKTTTLPFTKNMLKALKEAKVCVNAAKTKEEAKKCGDAIRASINTNSKAMMDAYDIDEEKVNKDSDNAFDMIEWNEEEKQKALKEMESAIIEGEKNVKCMESNADFKTFSECLKKEGIN